MTMTASNWQPVNFWNVEASGATLSLPSYASITSSSPFAIGYPPFHSVILFVYFAKRFLFDIRSVTKILVAKQALQLLQLPFSKGRQG